MTLKEQLIKLLLRAIDNGMRRGAMRPPRF